MKPEKTEDQKLKELFSTQLDQHRRNVPDFSTMWAIAAQHTAQINARRIRTRWAIAASLALCIGIGGYMVSNRQEHQPQIVQDETPIGLWKEPTRNLLVSQTGIEQEDLTKWTSPTDFLLPPTIK
ncbi:MAG: hypothetical protein ACOVOQ_14245 [Flavobacterium sp.]